MNANWGTYDRHQLSTIHRNFKQVLAKQKSKKGKINAIITSLRYMEKISNSQPKRDWTTTENYLTKLKHDEITHIYHAFLDAVKGTQSKKTKKQLLQSIDDIATNYTTLVGEFYSQDKILVDDIKAANDV